MNMMYGIKCLGMSTGAIYMSIYDLCKRWLIGADEDHPAEMLPRRHQPLRAATVLASGGAAGFVGAMVCTPLDVLKSRIQVSLCAEQYPRGVRSALREIYQEAGRSLLASVRICYRGLVPIVVRIVPANAACFFGVEFALHTINYFSQ